LFTLVNNQGMNDDKLDTLWTPLHCLSVLHEQGSFTAAAERLRISKAAMSQRISELERAAGVALVRRTTRSVRLTEAGEQLVRDTRQAFEQIASGFASVRDRADTPRGLIRLTAPVAFARQHLVHVLPDFLRRHPEVRVELDMSDHLRPLAQEGFDLAVRHTANPPETHVAWSLARTRTLLVASRAYLRRAGTPRAPEELSTHQCLLYPRPQPVATWSFARRGDAVAQERVTVPVRGPLAANNSEALRDAALAGLGMALLPDFSAQSALQSGRLVELLPDWQPAGVFGDQLFALRPYSPHVPRAVSALVGHLREAFAAGFEPAAAPR